MEGRFPPEGHAAAGSSNVPPGDASVVSVASSVSSMASSHAAAAAMPKTTASNSSVAAPLPGGSVMGDDSSIVSADHSNKSPTISSAANSLENQGSVKRINPFEQQIQANQHESESSSSVASPERPGPNSQGSSSSSMMVAARQPQNPSSVSSSFRSAGMMSGNFMHDDDDESTVPSSAVNSSDPTDQSQSMDGQDTMESDSDHEHQGSITKFIGSVGRRISTNSRMTQDDKEIDGIPNVDDALLGEDNLGDSLIGGYLQKLGRNGKWQTRWFETDGECLSYYKNEKKSKILATLDLEKVGAITIDPEDRDGLSFRIQVLGRLYHLRADSKASCKDWVITLNRVKEARMQQGNVKLVSLGFQQPVDLLDSNMPLQSDDMVAPRVVVMANRQRTKAVEEEQELNQLIKLEDESGGKQKVSKKKSDKRLSTIGTVVYARWTKRRSSMARLRSKIAKWAQSIRKLSCMDDEAVDLDNHVHPPGHDDKRSNHRKKPAAQPVKQTKKPASVPEPEIAGNRPRKMSTASEGDIRVLS